MVRRSFGFSRTIHKYLGLILGLYLLAMGASGLLLNHPEWLRSIDIPQTLVPADYTYRNWNRMLIRGGTITSDSTWYLAGKLGIARSTDQGRSFSILDEGFPASAYDRDTADLIILNEGSADHTLLAATRSGREIAAAAPMSLWHHLFEFHNGRIFEPWLGLWYLLIIPISGAILLLLCLSGAYDWWYRRK